MLFNKDCKTKRCNLLEFMSLLTPTQIKQLCEEYNLTPSKKYGQNYLISELPIQKMIAAADIKPGSRVYEIGPGFGILTFELLKAGAYVRAFEIEQKLRPYWEEYEKQYPQLEIVWGNALNQWEECVLHEKESYKVVANLPYQITSEMLQTILESKNPPSHLVCMVQKEVGERIAAKPGDMSILAVSVQYFGKPKVVAKVGRGSFWPSPKVDSAIISVTDIHPRLDNAAFFTLVKSGFHHKRKFLSKNLSELNSVTKESIIGAFKASGLNEKVRAEELSIEQWINLNKLLTR